MANQSIRQEPEVDVRPSTRLLDLVEDLLRVEKLVIKLLHPAQEATQDDEDRKDGKAAERPTDCKLGELVQELKNNDDGQERKEEVSDEDCKRVFHLLSHLPFVYIDTQETCCSPDSKVSLINPRSISKSTVKDGAAQCFLVIQESDTVFSESDSTEKLTFKSILDFVSESEYGSHIRLMSSIDKNDSRETALESDQKSADSRIQGRFFAEAHTFALAVQAMVASDARLSKLTSSYLE